MDEVALYLQEIIKQLFDIDQIVQLSRPDKKFGDFSTNVAMQLAGSLKQNPHEIAEKIVNKLKETGEYADIMIEGRGFINIKILAKNLVNILDKSWDENYGKNNDGDGKTVVVEFPSQNMAKPYSVGHLRSGNQGWAVKRLMEATGWKVITDNHLGDYGAPFGIWVVGFLKFGSEEQLASDGVYELGRVYIKTKKALKDEVLKGETTLTDQVQDWLLKLENGDEEAVNYSKRFNEISLKHINEVMSRLKISTDYELGESSYVIKGKEIVQDLLSEGKAKQNDDGSVIIPLDEFGIDTPFLIQKSNGAALYSTTDLATIMCREENWHPDRVIYVVGSEQQFYFTQLFAAAKKIGIKTELIHLWFGMIDQINQDGTREKMSSRKGVVLMEELLNQAEIKAREIVKDRDVSDEDVKKIALGAIKFSDFIADRRTNILFDWDKIFALSGFSGPYIQYAAVRVNKILDDNKNIQIKINDYDYESEKKVILKLLEYPEIVRISARDLEPHKIASYLYGLAKELNRYYESTPIAIGDVTEIQKQARLGLLQKVSQIFTHGLFLLGIEVPTTM